MDSKVNLEGMLLGYFIKYEKLLELSAFTLKVINNDTVNIYIDLYDMLKPIYTKDIYATKKHVIAATVINIAAHYRGYYRMKHHLNTRIFLIYADETSNAHSRYISGFGDNAYRISMNYEKTHAFIMSQLELAKILAAYIPDVYYIYNTNDFATVSADLIQKQDRLLADSEHILITKSKYAIQTVTHCYIETSRPYYVRIYRPKKYNGEDRSYFINPNNAFMATYNDIKSEKTLIRFSEIHPCLLSVLLSLTGLRSCNVPMVINTTTATGIIYEAIQNKRIPNQICIDPAFLYGNVEALQQYISLEDFVNRFMALDIRTQLLMYRNTPESLDETWNINLQDPDTVKYIANTYFYECPLDLNNL